MSNISNIIGAAGIIMAAVVLIFYYLCGLIFMLVLFLGVSLVLIVMSGIGGIC